MKSQNSPVPKSTLVKHSTSECNSGQLGMPGISDELSLNFLAHTSQPLPKANMLSCADLSPKMVRIGEHPRKQNTYCNYDLVVATDWLSQKKKKNLQLLGLNGSRDAFPDTCKN